MTSSASLATSDLVCPRCAGPFVRSPEGLDCERCRTRYSALGNTINLAGPPEKDREAERRTSGKHVLVLGCSSPSRLQEGSKRARAIFSLARTRFAGRASNGFQGAPEGWQALQSLRKAIRASQPDEIVVLEGKAEGGWRKRCWLAVAALHGRPVWALDIDTGNLRPITLRLLLRQLVLVRLNPFHSPHSPIKWLMDRKLRKYYARCMQDWTLAAQCQRDYLPEYWHGRVGRALDFGCWRGRFAALLTQLGFEVTGYDIAYDPFWQQIRGARFILGPPTMPLPFRDVAFDLCMHMGVLSYIPDDLGHLREIHRILRPGGTLVLQVAHRGHPRYRLAQHLPLRLANVPHFRFYAPPEIEELLAKSGFAIEHSRLEGFAPPICGWSAHAIRKCLLARRHDPTDRWGLLARLTPPAFRTTFVVFARKPDGSRPAAREAAAAGSHPSPANGPREGQAPGEVGR